MPLSTSFISDLINLQIFLVPLFLWSLFVSFFLGFNYLKNYNFIKSG